MKAFHLVGPAPFYTNSFLLISDAGNAVVIDPAAEVQEYDKILKEHGGKLSLILCTHGHYDHVGSAGVLSREPTVGGPSCCPSRVRTAATKRARSSPSTS